MDLRDMIADASSRYQTTAEMVTDVLRQAITRGILPGGHHLRQEELAKLCGVSRMPIREALRQLEAEGLLQSFPHRGWKVTTLSAQEVQEINEIRIALETLALRLAWAHLGENEFTHAEAILDEIDGITDAVRWNELNWEFHKTLYAAAKRPRLLDMIHNMITTTMRFPLAQFKEPTQKLHRQLLATSRRKELDRALQLIEQDILVVTQLSVTYIQQE